MVTERDRLGLDTVFASDAPLSSFDLAAFEGALDGFEELAAEPLDEAGRRAFVLAMRDTFTEEGKAPALADDTVAYLATFSDDLTDVRHAVRYLVTACGFPVGRHAGRGNREAGPRVVGGSRRKHALCTNQRKTSWPLGRGVFLLQTPGMRRRDPGLQRRVAGLKAPCPIFHGQCSKISLSFLEDAQPKIFGRSL